MADEAHKEQAPVGTGLVIEPVTGAFAICKVEDYSQVDFERAFCFVGKTDAERSLVCLAEDVPANATDVDGGWRALRVEGQLDFSLTGVLAGIARVLADEGIGIFAISTYDTDYILVKSERFSDALTALDRAGYGHSEKWDT